MKKYLKEIMWQKCLLLACLLIVPLISMAYSTEGSVTLNAGETATISLKSTYQTNLSLSGVTVLSYNWKSTNTSVVKVTSSNKTSCVVKAVASGTAKIQYDCSFRWDGYYRTFAFEWNITVNPSVVYVNRIELNKTSATMYVDDKLQLSASVYPTTATNRSVNWSTNNSTVATVSSNGLVTANSPGSATITCRATDGSGTSATCSVTVVRQKQAQTLDLNSLPVWTYGDTRLRGLPQTTNEGLSLTWSVANTNIAVISSSLNVYRLYLNNAGTTTVTATQAGNDDYLPFTREFTLTFNKALLTITAEDCTKQEGEENPELTISYNGFKYGEDASILITQPSITTAATKDSPAGTYPICVSGAESANYEFTYVDGTLTVTETEKPAVVDAADISSVDNAIYIEPFAVRIGDNVNIEICLKNAEAATAYVFDLVLPEGVTVAKNDKGKFIDALSDRHDDHTRTFNDKGNNTYGLSTLSGNSEELTGNDGAIRLLTLSAAEDLAEGVYAVEIKNASYSKPDGTLVPLPNTISTVTVEDYLLGDVIGNGGVDIGDAVTIVNYLVGKESTNFVEKAADTNKNGQIDIGDAVTIVNFLVGKTESLSRQANMEGSEEEPQ